MNIENRKNRPTEQMFEEAANWVARSQSGSMTAKEASAREHWLNADKRHRHAYARMESLLELTAGMNLSSPAEAAGVRNTGRQSWMHWSRLGFAIAAGVATIAIAVARLYPITGESVTTGNGELQTVALADGSNVTLRGDSSLQIRYGLASRRVTIDHGEAAFDVAHERLRDFVVETADVRVVALGTAFNVRVSDGLSTVTLIDGTVEVSDPESDVSAATGEILLLTPGEQVIFSADGSRSGVREADVAQVTAWQDGRIVLRRRPLSELVDELNRNFAGSIRIEDPELASIPVNVSMQLEDREVTLRRLEEQLPISIEPSDNDRFIVRRKTRSQ